MAAPEMAAPSEPPPDGSPVLGRDDAEGQFTGRGADGQSTVPIRPFTGGPVPTNPGLGLPGGGAAARPRTTVTEMVRVVSATGRAPSPRPVRSATGGAGRPVGGSMTSVRGRRPVRRVDRLVARLDGLDTRVLPPVGRLMALLGRGARRKRVIVTVTAVLSVVGVLLAVYAAARPSTPPVVAGPPIRVGVADGDSIQAYVVRTHTTLQATVAQAHPGQMYALVSFASYLKPGQLVAALSGVRVTNVFIRAQLSGLDTPSINTQAYQLPDDVTSAMLSAANHEKQAAADDRELAGDVTGSGADAKALRDRYRQHEALAEAEQTAYRSLCACVYAAIIYAAPAELEVLAARSGIRTVDAVPSLQRDRATFFPPLPEQTGQAKLPPADS